MTRKFVLGGYFAPLAFISIAIDRALAAADAFVYRIYDVFADIGEFIVTAVRNIAAPAWHLFTVPKLETFTVINILKKVYRDSLRTDGHSLSTAIRHPLLI